VRIYGNASSSLQFTADTMELYGNSDITIDFSNNFEVGTPSIRLFE
jgi:hypothetical protein